MQNANCKRYNVKVGGPSFFSRLEEQSGGLTLRCRLMFIFAIWRSERSGFTHKIKPNGPSVHFKKYRLRQYHRRRRCPHRRYHLQCRNGLSTQYSIPPHWAGEGKRERVFAHLERQIKTRSPSPIGPDRRRASPGAGQGGYTGPVVQRPGWISIVPAKYWNAVPP